MKHKTIWILFYKTNDYDQPDKAFKHIFWVKPTTIDIADELGYKRDSADKLFKDMLDNEGNEFDDSGTKFWIETFTENKLK